MLLLDTNVVSELRKVRSGTAHPQFARWAKTVRPSSAFISVITVHELEIGVRLAERRDPKRGAVLRAWLAGNVLPAFDGRILAIATAVAIQSARLHVPDPRPINDAYIAATALVHELTVVTRNVHDFDAMNVSTSNPWEG